MEIYFTHHWPKAKAKILCLIRCSCVWPQKTNVCSQSKVHHKIKTVSEVMQLSPVVKYVVQLNRWSFRHVAVALWYSKCFTWHEHCKSTQKQQFLYYRTVWDFGQAFSVLSFFSLSLRLRHVYIVGFSQLAFYWRWIPLTSLLLAATVSHHNGDVLQPNHIVFQDVHKCSESAKTSLTQCLNNTKSVSYTFPSPSMVRGNNQEAMGLHFVMFTPTLYSQCDPQQARKWLPLADSYQAVGTYAQTELGHGQSWT